MRQQKQAVSFLIMQANEIVAIAIYMPCRSVNIIYPIATNNIE